MSLPGLATADLPHRGSPAISISITPKSEWRFEVAQDQTITVKVKEGIAEIFGTELSNDITYTFTGTKAAIYTLDGATVEFTGDVSSEYVSEETQMDAYTAFFLALQNYRVAQTTTKSKNAPRVLILGGHDSGKTSLAKILASYSNRLGQQPMLVNLNPADGAFSVPGTITAAPISDILDVEDAMGWGASYTSGPTPLHAKQPTVRYFGHDGIHENLPFYKHLVSRMGVTVCSRMEEDSAVRESGMIVDTPALGMRELDLVEDVIADFEINVVVVVGNERLFIDIKKKLSRDGLNIVKVPKSGGCVERDDSFKRALQQRVIKEYFYGTPRTVLSPYTVNVDFTVVHVYQPHKEVEDSLSSVLPIDEEEAAVASGAQKRKKVQLLEKIDVNSATVQNAVVAILQADKNEDEDEVARSSVLGFAVISSVDDEKKKLRILIPVPGRLPDKVMVLGQFRYFE